MFSVFDTLVVTKIDALPYFNFDIDRLKVNIKRINPSKDFFKLSVKTDDKMTEFTSYLEEKINKKIGGKQENKN